MKLKITGQNMVDGQRNSGQHRFDIARGLHK
ncbi:hypothetical protein P3T21_006514 [Paraburkholderia sp. GAS334]